jgi:hypothetical protein
MIEFMIDEESRWKALCGSIHTLYHLFDFILRFYTLDRIKSTPE